MLKRSDSVALSDLDQLGLRIYAYILARIGFRSTPKPVPLISIATYCACTVNQVRYRLKKIAVEGPKKGVIDKDLELKANRALIRKWTVKHPTHFRNTFYRVNYRGDRRVLYKERNARKQLEH